MIERNKLQIVTYKNHYPDILDHLFQKYCYYLVSLATFNNLRDWKYPGGTHPSKWMKTCRVPPQLDLPSPSHDEGIASKRPASEGEGLGTEPPGQGESHQDQPPTESEQDDITKIVISGDDESTIQEPQGSSTPSSKPDQCWK